MNERKYNALPHRSRVFGAHTDMASDTVMRTECPVLKFGKFSSAVYFELFSMDVFDALRLSR
jgi:hypothetical protein